MIEFDSETHTYTDGGKKLISVTQLMRKHGLAPDYSGVPSEALIAAAKRGTLVHKEIEDYVKKGEIGFTKEVEAFMVYCESHFAEPIKSEFIVHNDIVAGQVDLLLKEIDGEIVIADVKTTSTLHKEAVSWQLSIYAYLSGIEITKAQAFHFDKCGELKVVDIPFKPKAEIEALFDAEREGKIYKRELVGIDANTLADLAEAERVIVSMNQYLKEAEERAKSIREAVMKAMAENGVKTFENDRLKITYVEPSTRTTLDSARLKKEEPEIAKKYEKQSTTKASLRITIKGE
jgi:hypothetical protein